MQGNEANCVPGVGRSGTQAIDLALRLTLLDLLLRPVGSWTLRPFILSLAIVALLRSDCLRRPVIWFALATLMTIRVLLDWPLADNHAYLLAYWCLAAGLACSANDPDAVLAHNGRLLVGLVFLFSCIWKFVLSDNYADATFFQLTFITDPRFEGFVRIAGGLDETTLDALRGFVAQHRDYALPFDGSAVTVPARLTAVAVAATVWNLFINAALAITFLWPGRQVSDRVRHMLLLVYCTVTYAIATVDGFGWLLLAMGAAQCRQDQWRLRYAYIAVFILIIFYREVPWAEQLFMPLLQESVNASEIS